MRLFVLLVVSLAVAGCGADGQPCDAGQNPCPDGYTCKFTAQTNPQTGTVHLVGECKAD